MAAEMVLTSLNTVAQRAHCSQKRCKGIIMIVGSQTQAHKAQGEEWHAPAPPTGRVDAHADQMRGPCSQGGACCRRLVRRSAPAAQTRALRTRRALAAVRGPRRMRLAGPPRPQRTPVAGMRPQAASPRQCLKLLKLVLSVQAGGEAPACNRLWYDNY
jgi:hypothetical protein